MSYFVSARADMRDAVEVVSASGHEHAADIAYAGGLEPQELGCLYVSWNGDIRPVTVEDIPEIEVSGVDDSEPPSGMDRLENWNLIP